MGRLSERSGSSGQKRLASLIKISLWIATALLLPTGGSASPQCTVEASTVPANIDGDVLVLAAGSLAYTGAHPSAPSVTTAEACSAACGNLPGCNAWTFCSRPTGCGSGCSSWVAKHPKLPQGGPDNRDPGVADLPILGFGPWTFPQTQNGCQYSFNTDSTSDAWPYGLCTLKRVADVKQLKYLPQQPAAAVRLNPGIITEAAAVPASADGWISGTLSVSGDCQGLPANVCKLCSTSKDSGSCLKCAKDARAQYNKKPVNYLIKNGSKAQNACSVCAGIADTGLRSTCMNCILNNGRCSTCVYGAQMWGYGPANITACLTCAARKGGQYAGACNACAQSKQPDRCFACLDTFQLHFCNGSSPTGTNGCRLGLNDQTPCDLCSNSAQSDGVFKQCLDCHSSSNQTQECLDCGSIPATATTQSRCYQCVQAARFPSYQSRGCAACFSSWLLPGKTQACLQCVESSSTPFAAKASCSACLDGTAQRSAAKQQQCLGCLKQARLQDYSATCVDQSRRRLVSV